MSDLAGWLSERGTALLAWMASTNLATAAVLAAAVLADHLLRRRVAAALRVWLYAAVVVRAALPPGWRSPWGLLGQPGGAADPAFLRLGAPVDFTSDPAAGAPAGAIGLWVALAYLAGVAVLLGRWAWLRVRLARALHAGRPARPQVAAMLPAIAVREHPSLGPLVAGLLRPRVVLPAALVDHAGDETLRWVLRHEAAHVARRDQWLVTAAQLANILAWPLLPLWIAAARVRALVEQACDERALAGAGAGERRRYGEILLALAETAGPGRFGFAPSFTSGLRGRLRALGFRRRWPLGAQLALVAGLTAAAIACAGAPEPPPPPGEAMTVEPPVHEPGGWPVLTIKSAQELYLGNRPIAGEALEAELQALAAQGVRRLLVRPARGVDSLATIDLLAVAKRAGVTDLAFLHKPEGASAASEPPSAGKPSDLHEVVRGHTEDVRACYTAALKRNPLLESGRLTVSLTVGASGSVDQIGVRSPMPDASALGECVTDAARAWKFPAGAGPRSFSFPIVLAPRGVTMP